MVVIDTKSTLGFKKSFTALLVSWHWCFQLFQAQVISNPTVFSPSDCRDKLAGKSTVSIQILVMQDNQED